MKIAYVIGVMVIFVLGLANSKDCPASGDYIRSSRFRPRRLRRDFRPETGCQTTSARQRTDVLAPFIGEIPAWISEENEINYDVTKILARIRFGGPVVVRLDNLT